MKTRTIKITGILITLVMLVTIFGAFSLTASAAEGGACTVTTDCTGTYTNGFCDVCSGYEAPTLNSDGYYEIDNAGKLYWFADKVDNEHETYGSINVILTKDITVNTGTVTAESTGMRGWTPVGDWDHQYGGTFDGNGKTISGLYYNDGGQYVALISCVTESGVVKNLTVTNSVFVGSGFTAAIVGYNYGTVSGCFKNAPVSGSVYSGGIVAHNSGTVELCGNTGTVHASGAVSGGIVARNMSVADAAAVVKNCWNTGNISNEKFQAGGIVGDNNANNTNWPFVQVQNCWSTGSASAPEAAGGVTGRNWHARVSNCYSVMAPVGTLEQGSSTTKTEQKTLDQFTSGEVAYLLGSAWGQTIGENGDAYPVFRTETNQVYQLTNCDGVSHIYTNDATETITEHQEGVTAASAFNPDGTCKTCGTQAVANLSVPDNLFYFVTLRDAVTAAKNYPGSTVMLLDDVKLSAMLEIPADCDLILDLNGKTISNAEDVSFSIMLVVYGKLTITDSSENKDGKIILSCGDSTSATIRTQNKLTVKNGTVANTAGGIAIVAAVSGITEPGTPPPIGFLIVENGTFIGAVNVWNETFSIYGGNFDSLLIYDRSLDAEILGEGLKGGSFGSITNQEPEEFSLADCLAEDYYIYGSDGNIVTPVADATDLANVTVKYGADLSAEAVVTVENATYNGAEQKPDVAVVVGGVTLTLDTDYTLTYTDNVNAGTASVTVTGKGAYSGSATKTFTIEKAIPTASDFTFSPGEFTYDGEDKTVTVTTSRVGMGTITVEYYREGGDQLLGAPRNAGTYIVKIDVAEGDNYKADTSIEIGTFTIEKATPVVTPPTPIEGLVYNGKEQVLVTPGSTTGGTLVYHMTPGPYEPGMAVGVCPDGNATATAAGLYTVIFEVQGDENYEDVAERWVTIRIAYATPTLTLTAPAGNLMPGQMVQMHVTAKNPHNEELTDLPTDFVIGYKIGENGTVEMINGLTFMLPGSATIGATLYVTVTTEAVDGKYGVGTSNTVEIFIGQVDYAGDIENVQKNLDEAKSELQAAIALKADTATLNEKVEALNAAIEAAEAAAKKYSDDQDAALKAEITSAINSAKDELVNGYTAAVNAAKDELYRAINDSSKNDAYELAKAVAGLETTIELAQTAAQNFATQADAALKQQLESAINAAQSYLINQISALEDKITEEIGKLQNQINYNDTDIDGINASITTINGLIDALEATDITLDGKIAEAINTAKNELVSAVSTLEDKIAEEVKKFQNQITSNDADIDGINTSITTINGLIDALKKADEALDGDISDAITKAENELKAAQDELKDLIGDVQTNLDNAKAELDKAIADLDAAMKQGDADLSAEIANLNTALTNAKAALEKADADNKAELVSKIETADATLDAAIKAVQKNLDDAKAELDTAIKNGDTALDGKITNLNAALESAKAALEKADADNKAELVKKIEDADATLDAAIKAVQKNLDDAKAELDTAIKNGDTALDGKISNLNAALESAKAALEATDAANKTELEGKITSAQTSLQAAINNVQTNLDNAKAELDKAIADLEAAMKQGDADLSTEIANLNTALTNAKAALEKADADNKAELVSKIETVDATLDAAIKAVQKNLDDAKAALSKAIADGDTALDGRITDLNTALESAKAALEATDAANKSELEGKITEAQTTLQSAIDKVAKDLADAEKELADAIASGDAALGSRISSVSASLSAAKTALEKADADNKAELIAKIEAAEATLDAAIKAVQKNLDDAKAALEKALADGDKANADALAQAISDLNAAIDAAETAAATADGSLKTELTSKIDNADAALQAAVDALSTELDATNEKVDQLETFIIIVCVISGVAFCGCGTLAVFYFIDKKKKI